MKLPSRGEDPLRIVRLYHPAHNIGHYVPLVDGPEKVDLITARAVRVDDELLAFVQGRLSPAGHFVYFGSEPETNKLSLVAQRRLA